MGLRDPSGDVRWYSVSSQPMAPEGSDEPDAVVSTIRDVSDGRRVEERLKRNASLLNAVGQAVVACDLDGRVTFINDVAAEMYEVSKLRDASGQVLWDIARLRVPEAEAIEMETTVRSGRTWEGELAVRRMDGSIMPVWVTISPLMSSGEPVGFVGVSVDMTERKEAELRMVHQARHDQLTDLLNRPALIERLDGQLDAMAQGDHVSVILVDAGPLEVVSDAYGHAIGDQAIVRCAAELNDVAHAGDTIARVADHTFAVCCSHASSEAAAIQHAEALRSRLSEPRVIDGVDLRLKSAAAVAWLGLTTDDAAEVLRCVGTALLLAKRDGNTRVYDDSMRARLLRDLELERLTDKIIAADEVTLGYQPIVRLSDELTIGAEALLRICDPDGEPIPALDIVEAAERRGRIADLGDLIMRQACLDAASWQRALPDRQISISVNVSARQLDDPTLPAKVAAALDAAGLDPSCLCLEITESALMSDAHRTAGVLTELKLCGVRLSADDFGTGYSSLAYLKRFPLDVVKIDRSFVAGLPESLEDVAITRAVIGMADALGLTVVAEGIESEAQHAELRSMGAAFGQGYLWSAAITAEDLLDRALAESDAAASEEAQRDESGPSSPGRLVTGASPEERIDSVLNVLAHELRTPLTVVTGYASMLARVKDPDDADAAINIGRAAWRISRILDDMVEASRSDHHAMPVEVAETDVAELVERVGADLRHTIRNPLRLSPPSPGELTINVDAAAIEQVLHNLVSNAVKYSPPGSPIDIVVATADGCVDIEVLDEGCGIQSDQIGLVFRKYGRGASDRAGTGLGLYLARRIARRHGGDIIYRRRSDRAGSVLTLRLPRVVRDA